MARSETLSAAPIEVRSALDRKAKIAVAAAPPPPKPVVFETESAADDDDDAVPEWPDAAVEDAMRAELAGRDTAAETKPKSRRAAEIETLAGGALPDLQALVATIPAEVKATLDELFRAQFESVRRVPAAVLKKEVKD